MPHDLFGDVNLRPSSVRSHRSPVVVVSILVHVAALVALCVVPLLATDTLPTPRRVIDYFLPHEVMPVVVPAPSRQTPSSNLGPTARPDSAPSTAAAAPLDAPTGITTETGKEGGAESARAARTGGARGGPAMDVHADVTERRPGADHHDGDGEFHAAIG